MTGTSRKPTIFISYSHKDEPDPGLHSDKERWLTFVRSHLGPAEAHGHLRLWDDRKIGGGGDWKNEIDVALSECVICILLVSRHSLTSRFILDVEMKQILERHHAQGAHLYPIVITACDIGAAKWLMDLNLRPRDGTPLELYPAGTRNAVMADLATEIRSLLASPHSSLPRTPSKQLIDLSRLPETAYKRLVGRDAELELLNRAWNTSGTNIISLIAWGGAGKTTLVSDWLTRLQRDNYREADAVLAWSFYDQGTKERATSADLFLDWALRFLGHTSPPSEAVLKGGLLSDTLRERKVLLILDGVEPLQFGPGPQEGLLKDAGLRTFLRKFSSEPPNLTKSLVVITSRLAIKDIKREATRAGTAPVHYLDKLSDEAGVELLSDNEVVGPESELLKTSQEFGGHALALSLLSGFLVRRHGGDVRRRTSIGPLLAPEGRTVDEQVHGHAKRVMRSVENEWLVNQPHLIEIMRLVSLFDRPARADLLEVFRRGAPIDGVTESVSRLSDEEWLDAIADLRSVRLLAPADSIAVDDLDTHPLVKDWFASDFERRNKRSWQMANRYIYEQLKQTVEGEAPTLAALQPLYQAIRHGCEAGKFRDAFRNVYVRRIARVDGAGEALYSTNKLGSRSTDLAILAHFFEQPYNKIHNEFPNEDRVRLFQLVGLMLFNVGRIREAAKVYEQLLKMAVNFPPRSARASIPSQLANLRMFLGDIVGANKALNTAVTWARQNTSDIDTLTDVHQTWAHILSRENKLPDAKEALAQIRRLHDKGRPSERSVDDFDVTEIALLLECGEYDQAKERCLLPREDINLVHQANITISLAQAELGIALELAEGATSALDKSHIDQLYDLFAKAIQQNTQATNIRSLMQCYLSRSILSIAAGNWSMAAADLAEAEDIASYGPMVTGIADVTLRRARAELCRANNFIRFGGAVETVAKGQLEKESIYAEAAKFIQAAEEILIAADYKRRTHELSQLRDVLTGRRDINLLDWVAV